MSELIKLATSLAELSVERLVILLAFAGIGLAAFAIYAVFTMARQRERR